MASVTVYLRKGSENSEEHALYLRVLINRQFKPYSLKRTLHPKFWDADDQKVLSKAEDGAVHGNAKFLNNLITDKVREIEKIFDDFEKEERPLTIGLFHEVYTKKKKVKTGNDFYSFFDDMLEEKKQKVKLSENTLRSYAQFRSRLQQYKPNLCLPDITPEFLEAYKNYLRKIQRYKVTTTGKQLNILRTFVKIAFNRGMIKSYPFAEFTVKKGKGKRKFLPEEDVQKIQQLSLENIGQIRARRMFLFACCTGMAFVDLMKLKWRDLDANWEYVHYVRKKVAEEYNAHTEETEGIEVVVPVLPMAKQLLKDQHSLLSDEIGRPPVSDDYVFHRISNQKYNEHLHNLEEKAGTSKSMTSHVARHTCATLLLSNDVSLEAVASILGHEDIRTTKIYADMIPKAKKKAMEKVEHIFS